MGTLAEMYVQGVSTRKVKSVTEALCGHEFSASSISAVNKSLDAALTAFSERRLSEPYPYLILDARYERVREGGVIASHAVLIAVAVDSEGRRQVLAVELANRESRSSWRDFLLAGWREPVGDGVARHVRRREHRLRGAGGAPLLARREETRGAQSGVTSINGGAADGKAGAAVLIAASGFGP